MDDRRIRSIILNLQHCPRVDDQRRLYFYLDNDALQKVRDHPTLGGILSLIGSLMDKNRINNKDMNYMINAFEEIQCVDVAKFSKEYQDRNLADDSNISLQSLSDIMPRSSFNQLLRDKEEEEYHLQSCK
ncbi:hypothetical protein I4U23_004098 [Adineta vaga]|nr:hypothetical protein I4U23_004098 [Adineta vaga]